MQAERDWDDYKMAEFMEDKLGEEYDCFVASVTSFGLFVQLDNLVEGLVHIRELQGDYYIFDETQNTLRGKRNGTEYKIGDKMRVQLVRVNKDLGQVDFIPIGEQSAKKNKASLSEGGAPKGRREHGSLSNKNTTHTPHKSKIKNRNKTKIPLQEIDTSKAPSSEKASPSNRNRIKKKGKYKPNKKGNPHGRTQTNKNNSPK